MAKEWTPKTEIEHALYDAYVQAKARNKNYVLMYKNDMISVPYDIKEHNPNTLKWNLPQFEASKHLHVLALLNTYQNFQDQWPYASGTINSVADLKQNSAHPKSLPKDAPQQSLPAFGGFDTRPDAYDHL